MNPPEIVRVGKLDSVMVLVVLGVALGQLEAAAGAEAEKPPSGPPKPAPNLVCAENPTRTVSGRFL